MHLPSREDVKIVNIEGGYYAVLRYSGRASDGNFLKHKEILEKELQKSTKYNKIKFNNFHCYITLYSKFCVVSLIWINLAPFLS